MEKYSKAVSEMYSQFKKKEAHPMEKYIGKHAVYMGETREVVGYCDEFDGPYYLIVVGLDVGGWSNLGPYDVVFKKCERYGYVSSFDVID